MKKTSTVGIAAALALALSSTAAHAAVKTGTDRSETIRGTNRADTIDARGGNDKVQGLGGNDRLKGGFGNDVVNGGPGNDVCEGNEGNDLLLGEDGNDTFYGGFGDDQIIGGNGIDTADYSNIGSPDGEGYGLRHAGLYNGEINTSILGVDSLTGVENLIGTKFKDRIFGSAGPNVLRGGAGEDFLNGQGGIDALTGGTGVDWFYFAFGEISGSEDAGDFTITDFTRGQDKFTAFAYRGLSKFSDYDTNGNGQLDSGDTYVRIGSVSVGGRFLTSTTIDVTGVIGLPHTLTFYGVVGLTASDFREW